MAPALSDIRQIGVVVTDVAVSLPYYRDVLGLKFLFSPRPEMAFLQAGDVRIMLTLSFGHGQAGANSAILYFSVKDIEATQAAIVARGGIEERGPQLTAKMPDHEFWTGILKDPDGNLIGLMEEKR